MNNIQINIDTNLVHRLVTSQFPQWKDLLIQPVAKSGWDNRTFHLGSEMLIRMPSDEEYAFQVEKEQYWLPKLAPLLPLEIPSPLAMGEPGEGYPWKWSIYRWIEGESASKGQIDDITKFAATLAGFLLALHAIDSTNGPKPGPHNFYRGGDLSTYDAETKQAINVLKGKIDVGLATEIWESAIETSWQGMPVWIHGDVSVGNLLVKKGRLSAVIDFGQLGVGDPACDLAIAWTFFKGESREVFRKKLQLDVNTWARGRAWTLWKGLIVAAGITDSNAAEAAEPLRIIDEIIADHVLEK
ncbi:MAG: aminoglycoside phosphotransferase family protein [Candidatus Babeliales bacterium]|uniref:Aminoglycoside phosphotransferase family protein n=1 Tax=Candidatus Berkiella aquae TaxID=295108 RepID=A0A0Q9YF42_9GAMM|nr:aminoglycoside phosphotransferase family protein [Candidatus Berkiella aquae]MCS5712911.1 aminoglycoside phosphotransferase family protein [Candidatus Berkiella aquae]